MNVAVTDKKGNYVTGLKPQQFAIVEDGVPQQTATFEEGNLAPVRFLPKEPTPSPAKPARHPVPAG